MVASLSPMINGELGAASAIFHMQLFNLFKHAAPISGPYRKILPTFPWFRPTRGRTKLLRATFSGVSSIQTACTGPGIRP